MQFYRELCGSEDIDLWGDSWYVPGLMKSCFILELNWYQKLTNLIQPTTYHYNKYNLLLPATNHDSFYWWEVEFHFLSCRLVFHLQKCNRSQKRPERTPDLHAFCHLHLYLHYQMDAYKTLICKQLGFSWLLGLRIVSRTYY